MSKKSVLDFYENPQENICELQEHLQQGTYCFGNYRYFAIRDPKVRIISAAPFSDRVLHHAIMNICTPEFERYQIYHSYACRKGKGTFAALEQAYHNTRKYKWYLKLDVKKYFDSIDHKILFEKLQSVFKDKQLLNVFWSIIDSYNVNAGKGVPIGNLTSQFFANHYLSYADRYITEFLHIPAYIRYMDDMLLWADSYEELLEKGLQFERFLGSKLLLELKPFVLNKSVHGLPALGFIIYPFRIDLNRRSRKRFIEKMNCNYRQLNNGEIDEDTFSRRCYALYGFISHARHKSFATKVISTHHEERQQSVKVTVG
jgi:retron-type reverse transcriptase